MSVQTANQPTKPQRRWDIDWLRVLATLLLIYYHSARIFYLWGGWYIQDNRKSIVVSYISLFIEQWHMPLFFLLAGAASWFALRRRSGGQYVVERLKRLLVPCVFGVLVIVPPQIYFNLLKYRPSMAGSYFRFYPHFFDANYTGGKFDMGHLWFILFLFVFSLVALPLFLYLRSDSGQRLLGKVAPIFCWPGMILTLAIPIIGMKAVPIDYPSPVYYLIYFIYGFILMANPRFEEAIGKHKVVALILGIALFATWAALWSTDVIQFDWIAPVRESVLAWLCLVALLGYGKRLLSFTNTFLTYFSRASYPLYIFHQTVIVIIGFYVIKLAAGTMVKLALITAASLMISIALYELVKRTDVTRFLFGMRPLKKQPEASES